MNKKNMLTLILGVFSIVFILLKYSESAGICSGADYRCITTTDKAEYVIFVIPLAFFFSLVTLFTKETVFLAWWKFARWGIPFVLAASFIISLELHHSPGGWFNLDKEVDLVITTFVYLLFIFGSAWQMYRGFRVKG